MTVIPDKYNFTIWQGATFNEQLTLYSDADMDTVRNLTGYSAEMIIRDKPRGSALYTLSTANGRIQITGASGLIELQISASDTAGFTWKGGSYDLTITSPSPSSITDALLYGSIKVLGI